LSKRRLGLPYFIATGPKSGFFNERKLIRGLIQGLAISIFFALNSTQVSVAEPPPLPEDIFGLEPFNNLLNFGVQCEGKSDLPHISTHKPGTVNVQARTQCPGKGVEITSRLTRILPTGNFSITKSNQGTGRTTVNVSLKCIWKKGAKKIRYEIYSVHRLSDGQIGYTQNYHDLAC
jgi:hypothetical protein